MKEIITALIGVMILVGCSSSDTNQVKSKLQRDLNPQVTQEELKQLVKDNNSFALSIFKAVDSSESNTFLSPISISHALMMTYAGANGDTKGEMKTALNLTLDDDKIDKAFNKLDLILNTDEFKIANSIWPCKSFSFEQNYLDTIMVNYGASLKTLDYQNSPDESRKTINSWVEDKTEDKIKDLIPKGAIDSLTKMVITNAVYFKGEWEHAFYPENTKKELFDGKDEVEFMSQTEVFPYYEDDSMQAVKLEYKGGKNSMILILPKDDSFTIPTDIDFKRYRVTLKMPKFEFTTNSMSLTQTMNRLGMKKAFNSNEADFTTMSKNSDLYISDIVHKAFIKVDEYGTEAAAATAVLIKNTGFEEATNVELTLDRPFIYQIIDNETGQILFIGHLVKP